MHRRVSSLHAFASAMLSFIACEARGEISVHTDFDGGSAKVVSIDQKARIIRFKPGGDAARGWPCWWFFRVEGLPVGEDVTFEVMASEQPLLTDDKRKGKRIGLVVTGPDSAFMSWDGATWTQTPVGEKKPAGATPPDVMSYRIKTTASVLWLVWGPPFLPKDTAAQKLVRELAVQQRFAAYFDLHNPGTSDRSFFFALPKENLPAIGAERQSRFIAIAREEFKGVIPLNPITKFDGPGYSRFWRRISKNWVHSIAAPDALKLTLETANNVPGASIAGYRETGTNLGRSVAKFLQQETQPQLPAK